MKKYLAAICTLTILIVIIAFAASTGEKKFACRDQKKCTLSKGEWQWPSDTIEPLNTTRYLKSSANADLSYRVTKPVEFYAGCDYTFYHWKLADGFPPRFALICGTRVMMP